MSDDTTCTFQAGRIRVDVRARSVTVDGQPAKLGGRAFDLLHALMQRSDRLVPKQELLEVVWPGLVVEENNLQVHVMNLRKLLGPESIVTASGRGYRFTLLPDGTEAYVTPADARRSTAPKVPSARTSLIGRDALIASTCALLRRDDVRLVTLSGPGGAGKTRVGLRVTADLAEHFADGSYVVMLAAVRGLAHVPSAIATALNVQESGNRPIKDLVIAWLRSRAVLLTLDNFEHVAGAAPLIDALLAACPGVKLLITSRTPLKLASEQDVRVPPLPLPDPDATASAALASPAVRLLLDRAHAIGYPIGERKADLDAAADICRRVDGLPLAIELAAARLRMLSPRALAARLGKRLGLLRGSARDLPARQRTLRNTIDWSYELLSADEQRLFRSLATFVGGWTLEAAEALAEASGVGDTLELLSALIDHSLVQRVDDVNGEPRFSMLETVREYAAERLHGDAMEAALRTRHADFFASFAEEVERHLQRADRAEWIVRGKTEYNNARAALAWVVVEQPDAARALRLAGAMAWLWYFAGQFSEGRGWLQLALALPDAASHAAAQARALSGAARLALYSGARDEALALARDSIALFRTQDDRRGLALVLVLQGIALILAKDSSQAAASFDEALACFRALGDEWGMALAITYHGTGWAVVAGEEQRADALLLEGRARFRALGDEWGVTTSSHYLGTIAMRRRDYAAARELTEEMLATARELGDGYRVARNLHQLAEIAFAEGDIAAARRHLQASLVLGHEQGRLGDVAQQLRLLAQIEAADQRTRRCVRLYGAASRLAGGSATIPADDPAVHADVLAPARAALGERAFDAEWTLGAALPLERAIATALEQSDDVLSAAT